MNDLRSIELAIERFRSLDSAKAFFECLGYPTLVPLREDLGRLPEGARSVVSAVHRLVDLGDGSPLRIFHVDLKHPTIRRTDIRRFLEFFYRHYPQGENLFVFAPPSYDEIAFVSPRRLPDPRDRGKVRLWLRILAVRRERPYRTDLEVLRSTRTDGILDPQKLWRRHDEAFSVQRVTKRFFEDYAEILKLIQARLQEMHHDNEAEWGRDYAHHLLNRIMFLYFIARKGWFLGPDGQPDRDFMRHFWEAYRDSGQTGAFHSDWLPVLFFEAFNNRWQNRPEYLKRFPHRLVSALAQAPFLNGGLYTKRRDLEDILQEYLPDDIFELLFEKWTDGAFPGFFERYNFTVVETGRFDEEVAVDPQMLGTVYERLVNGTYQGNLEPGVVYTHRTEIDLMCRLSLTHWLANHLGAKRKDLLYNWLFAFGEEDKQEADKAVTVANFWGPLNELVRGGCASATRPADRAPFSWA